MIKRVICYVCLVAMMFTFAPMSLAKSNEPTITVSSATVNAGDEFELVVAFENNPGINTFALGFDYDKTKLTLTNVELNENLGGSFAYKERAVWLNNKDIKYNGEVLTLKFKVLDSAKGGETKVKVTYSSGDISNYNEEDVSFKVEPGTVSIGSNEVQTSVIQRILSFFRWMIEMMKELISFGN